tara:strand:- start:213 stop:773 length:561 start_codon:yes stop_codon:yes gene_type:complete
MNILDNLRKSKTANQSPMSWYSDNAKRLKRIKPKHLMRDKDNLTPNAQIGRMYMFNYNPKTKEKLPYYDRFPLVIPIEPYSDGFLGLNFHYLKPKHRLVLINALINLASDQSLSENAKIQATYKMLSKSTKYKWFKPTLKRYLNSHVQSNFLKILPSDWQMAIFLPVERFEKSGKKSVWADSGRMV